MRFPSELRAEVLGILHPLNYNWFTNLIYRPHEKIKNTAIRADDDGIEPKYNKEGFLAIQNAIAAAYVKRISNKEIPKIQVHVSLCYYFFQLSAKTNHITTLFQIQFRYTAIPISGLQS